MEWSKLLADVRLVIDRNAVAFHPGVRVECTLNHAHPDTHLTVDAFASQHPAQEERARQAGGGKGAVPRRDGNGLTE